MLSLQKITRVAETSRTNKARDNPSMELGKCREQKGVYPGSTKRQQESPRCHIDGHVSSQKCGVATKITEVQWQNCVLGRHYKRRLWSLRSVYWTRLVSVPDDCRKRHGCYRKITRLSWTSSWCRICPYSSKIGGCSHIAQNFKIRMSRH